jgi:hypothetical protein
MTPRPGTYTNVTQEPDGRASGITITVGHPRRDGKIPCTHVYATSGRVLRKAYSPG